LGTGHASLEPGFLFQHRFTDSLTLFGELKDWIALGGTEGAAGNVLRYGLGVSYDLWENQNSRVTPVVEVVGWTVLSGKFGGKIPPLSPVLFEAAGDTIVNLKLGCAYTWREKAQLYVGYGFALTNEVWYQDVRRVQLRFMF